MALKEYRPTSSARRHMTVSDFADVTKAKPEKKLTRPLKKSGGRNSHGHITTRHIGGGHKRRYRVIDWRRDKDGVPAKVAAIEYDPNRSANIALVHYADGEKRYILHPRGLRVGATVVAGSGSEIRLGNAVPLKEIPLGTTVHNVELEPGRGGRLIRSAGSGAQVVAREGNLVTVRLPSTEVRMIPAGCMATIGQVGNVDHENISWGKAGRARWAGRRPKVRGVAMNPVDHPLGGGEGKASGGRPPVSPWGKPEGRKTRDPHKGSSKLIVRRRRRGKATE